MRAMTTLGDRIAQIQARSNNSWEMAIETAGPEYPGGSELKGENMRDLSDACGEAYDDALSALEAGDLHAARTALEMARSLEAMGGDCSDATGALRLLDDAAADTLTVEGCELKWATACARSL